MPEKKKQEVNLHANHRERVRKRYLSEGGRSFPDHNLLEMLLFFSIPREDTNDIAHLLLKEFGSFSAVFDASYEDLQRVKGIGPNSALHIKLITEVARRYMVDRAEEKPIIDTTAKAVEYLRNRFIGLENETAILLCLDGKFNIKRISEYTSNSSSGIILDINKMVLDALNCDAHGIVLAHNHIHGFAAPSRADDETTRQLAKTLENLEISVCDHIIFSKGEVYSFAQNRKNRDYGLFFSTIKAAF